MRQYTKAHKFLWHYCCTWWCQNKLKPVRVRVRVRVKVTLHPAVYRQSVRPGVKPLETHDQYFFNRTLAVIVLMLHPLWWQDGSVIYICCWSCQRSHSQVGVPRDSWPYFTVSDSRLPQPGGPGPRIHNPLEQGGPVIPPGTVFPFRRLLRLEELRWRYSTTPPHGGMKHVVQ
jgi:hypothetical protein